MRVVTTTTKVFKFNELSNEAKDKAVSNLSGINVDYDWFEYGAYEDAGMIDIEITEFDLYRRTIKVNLNNNFETICTNIIETHGKDCDTFKTAQRYLTKFDALVAKYSDGINTNIVAEGNESDFDLAAEMLSDRFKVSIAFDYLNILDRDYNYLTSEAAIIETIEANDYEFTSEGELF